MSPAHGIHSVFVNDLLKTGGWKIERAWFWKERVHINLLETRVVLSLFEQRLRQEKVSRRLNVLLDSTVARCALAKGRSSSRAIQHLLRKAASVQLAADLYPSYSHAPTKLNIADDPTRKEELRIPSARSLLKELSIEEMRRCQSVKLSGGAANWVRLIMLMLCCFPSEATASSANVPQAVGFAGHALGLISLLWIFSYLSLNWPMLGFTWPSPKAPREKHFRFVSRRLGPLVFGFCWVLAGAPMVPDNAAEFSRAERRAQIDLTNRGERGRVSGPASKQRAKAKASRFGASTTERPKRVTTASLAAAVQDVVATLPTITEQMRVMLEKQKAMEERMNQQSSVLAALSQPLGGRQEAPVRERSLVAGLASPPRMRSHAAKR